VAAALGLHLNHLSNHLRVLREAKLVLYERRKLQRIYRLTPAASIEISGGSLILRLQADDGSGLAFSLPTSSTIVRMLARDVWESSRPLPEPKPPRAPAPHDQPRRPSI
jgi:DNA-binding transcriptional ArsR family regulator